MYACISVQPSSAVANFSLYDGCSDIYTNDIAGKVVAITRGNCTFTEKAVFIQRHGGIAALIVDYANESSVVSSEERPVVRPPADNTLNFVCVVKTFQTSSRQCTHLCVCS